MAVTKMKEVFYDGYSVVVEVARKDVYGRDIPDTYLLKADKYVLPIATESSLGGIKVGDGLEISEDGTLKVKELSWNNITAKPFETLDSNDFIVLENVLSINEDKYTTKTYINENYYTQTEINDIISKLKAGMYQIVETLPSTGEDGIIYLVGTTTPYEMYIWENNSFIKIGDTEISLDGYVKGEGLEVDKLVVGNSGSNIKTTAYSVGTSITESETILPTSKAVYDGLALKQDKLTAGNGITIEDNVIASVITAVDVEVNIEE